MNPVNQDRHQIQFLQSFLVQLFQLCRAGLHELAAHAGFLDPIAIEHALHRPPIVPRGQPGHDPFPHRPLPSPVVLQPRVTVELNFFALARAHPRTLDRYFLPGKHHIARLLTPAQATRRRIRLVARPYASHHFILDHCPNDLQPRQTGQVFDLGLQFLPHFHQR